jgi:hypothetical protein
MIAALLTCALLVSACLWLHSVVLRYLWAMTKVSLTVKRPMLKILFTLFGLHLFEVLLYAIAISLHEFAGFGMLDGNVDQAPSWFMDHFYFSIASYTTLGIGDIVPHGSLRLISGVEALNGLILIAWSASFTYLVMERFWGMAHLADGEKD